jgi:hypothetical protein
MNDFHAIDAYMLSEHTADANIDVFNAVRRYVEKKIKTAATLGRLDTVCQIPAFISDIPAYKQDVLILVIKEHLDARGFHTIIIGQFNIYVSWRYAQS